MRSSGELFRRPGGVFARGRRGEEERRGRPSYRHRGGLETARISAGLKAEEWRQFPVRERRNGGEDDADRWVRG
jgi:hypothetical protein